MAAVPEVADDAEVAGMPGSPIDAARAGSAAIEVAEEDAAPVAPPDPNADKSERAPGRAADPAFAEPDAAVGGSVRGEVFEASTTAGSCCFCAACDALNAASVASIGLLGCCCCNCCC